MVPLLYRAFGIDKDVGDVLDIAHFPWSAADFEQRIVGVGGDVGRIEAKDATEAPAPARGKLGILTLDVVNDDARAG